MSQKTNLQLKPKKGLALTSLIVGILSLPTLGLFLLGALVAIFFGIYALIQSNRNPSQFGGRGLAISGIVCGALSILLIPVITIFAALAVPIFVKAKIESNESQVLSDVRAIVLAEEQYSAINEGYYGTLECLAMPEKCIPNYGGQAFLDAAIADASEKNGYKRSFHYEVDLRDDHDNNGHITSFYYVAIPINPMKTGIKVFCGDSSGVIYTKDTVKPHLTENSQCDISQDWQETYDAKTGMIIIDANRALRLHENGALFIDARVRSVWEEGHIPGSLSLLEDDFESSFANIETRLREASDIVVYCSGYGCTTSAEIAGRLQERGIRSAIFVDGFPAWFNAGYDVEASPSRGEQP